MAFLYFAYGSNMDPVQMRRRCPSARFVGVARLNKHRLAFTRRSTRRRCGVADVIPDRNDEVWGVVYRIVSRRDVRRLDEAEGFRRYRKRGNSYQRELRRVRLINSFARDLLIEIYLARPQRYPPRPSRDYIGHLRRGARHWGLPPDYQANLTQISFLA